MTDPWIVVRCQGQKTLDLTEDFVGQGIRAWTPVWRRRQRLPRTRKTLVVEFPCLPGYIFAGEEHLQFLDAFRIGGGFRGNIMTREDGSFIRVDDRELHGLREVSDYEEEKPLTLLPEVGSSKRIIDGPFAGLNCQVVGLGRSCALVSFTEGFAPFGKVFNVPTQIPYILLDSIAVDAAVETH